MGVRDHPRDSFSARRLYTQMDLMGMVLEDLSQVWVLVWVLYI